MKFSDQFRTGWRNLGRQKLRSSLTIFAIVIGALSVTVMLSLVTSAKSFLNSSLERTGEDRRVIVTRVKGIDYRQASEGDTAGDSDNAPQISDDIVKQVGAIQNVEHFTPVANADFFRRVSLPGGGESARRPRVIAYEPNGTVVRDLSAGRELTADDAADNGVLITTTIANALGFRGNLAGIVGQTIQLNWDEKFFQGQQEADKQALQCPPGNDFPDCPNNKQNKEKFIIMQMQ
jgi:putative ABC transport system permease protein